MTIALSSDKDVWESQYLKKGEVWRGRSDLPFKIPKGRVLELGCGNGKTVDALRSAGIEPICIDISRNALTECAKAAGPGAIVLVEADVTSLPFADGIFDSVVCFHLLEHLLIGERKKASMEIARVMRKGGRLYVQSFSVKDMRYGKGTEVEDDTYERGDGVRYHYFLDGELEELFDGFVPKEMKHKVLKKRYDGRPIARDMLQLEMERR
ncbi:MAG: class I SAM-dependent methyltransferase [Euryarchaeota archaeon]|nr:class I SAM-dependent methyltransferase [Euryarchaeota archaeon]